MSVGDELVLGQTLDTNSGWLSDRLVGRGITTVRHVTVPDDVGALELAIRHAAGEAELVIVTGGLGPTPDDLTREALARALGARLVEDDRALAEVHAWFKARNREMPKANRVQAMRPASARCLSNPVGTAPGLAARLDETDIFCLPGPPNEMVPMFERFVTPALRTPPGRVVRTRTIRTFGLGESRVAGLLGDLMRRDRLPLVGTTASRGVVGVRIRWEGEGTPAEAENAIARTEASLRERLGPAVLTPTRGSGEECLAELVLSLLRARAETLSSAESCTGGLLGAMLTDVPGSSDVYAGGWVTYSNVLKRSALGVPGELFPEVHAGAPGAVSASTAIAMSEGARARAQTRHALAITGIAGPGGGSDAKPVGTVWICLASGDSPHDCRRFLFGGDRPSVREWAALSALAMLRLRLMGLEMTLLGEQERAGSQE